jgi:hypothetical protein
MLLTALTAQTIRYLKLSYDENASRGGHGLIYTAHHSYLIKQTKKYVFSRRVSQSLALICTVWRTILDKHFQGEQ